VWSFLSRGPSSLVVLHCLRLLSLLLTPKGLGLPNVGFSDFGQAAVDSFYF
jgi:hypothetical protein